MSPDGAPAHNSSSTASRRGLYLPFVALGLFAALWSGFWFFAASRAKTVMDGFMQREAQRGRDWVCPNRSSGGFPFRIEIRCDRPQLIERGEGGLQREASLGGLLLQSRILSPGHYVATLSPPFVARQGTERELTISWQRAQASLRGGAQSFTDADIEVIAPVLAVGIGENRDQTARAKDFSMHIRRSPGEVKGTDLVFRLGEISLPLLDQRMGNPEPVSLEFQATAPGLLLEPNRPAVDALETWRLAQGKMRVILAKANKGQAAIELSGTLSLDGERRMEGALNGRARNIEALTSGFARRTGFDLGAMLGRLGGNQGLPVALTLENGRMRFGPFNLIEYGPLY
jgi:hypothetical protein